MKKNTRSYLTIFILFFFASKTWVFGQEETQKSFKHSFTHLNQKGADNYLIKKTGIKKYSEWQNPPITYYGPSANGKESKLTYKYSFSGRLESAKVRISLATWNFNAGGAMGRGSGSASAWASNDGETWINLIDIPTPAKLSQGKTFDEFLPVSLLGKKDLFLQIRLKVAGAPNSSYTVAQFGRADANSKNEIFSIEASYSESVNAPPKNKVSLKEGLVAWYPLDGNASDMSGNGFHGIVRGANTTDDRSGISNKAYKFDGEDDYIEIPNFNWNKRSNCTISLWSKYEHLPKEIDKDYGMVFGMNKESHCIFLHQDKLFFRQGWGNGWINAPKKGEWHNFALTWDGTARRVAFYHNARKISEHKAYQDVGLSAGTLRIGSNDRSLNYFFKGSIDDVRIYDRALSEEEVLALYELESTNPNEDRPTPPPAPGTGGLTPPDPDYKDTIAELKRLLAEKEKKLAHCETEMAAKEKQIGDLTSTNAKLQGDVKSLNGKVTALETEVAALKTDNEGLKEQIQHLREDNQNISNELTVANNHLEEAIRVAETPFINGWVYDPVRGWLFTDAEHFPLVYTHKTDTWHYYELGSSEPRYFYNYTSQEWVAWDAAPEETQQLVASNNNL